MKIAFDNTYARLPERFYARVAPTKVRDPRLVRVNRTLAAELGLDVEALAGPAGAQLFSGNVVPEGADPIALAYAGHQFGHFVPQLGDGRAILLGELTSQSGKRLDLQLKGAGRTSFSRGGDGRAALGPVLREYVLSEAMFALGVPTTRALAAVTSGETVVRDAVMPGAVFTRVAASHLRVGTFEFFAARQDRDALTTLTSYALRRHYPQAVGSPNDALALLECVVDAHARLVARWLGVGFVHGVMNTDNTSISGETIDYGPCAFLDEYDPGKTFSSIDQAGRYAFASQPQMAQWNMARLAECLLPLVSDDDEVAQRLATERVDRFQALFEAAHARVLRAKLGLLQEQATDVALASDVLDLLAASRVDYTVFFRRLCAAAADRAADGEVAGLFSDPATFHHWAAAWRRRLDLEAGSLEARAAAMRLVNPAFIPRNHRIEEAIQAALRTANFEPFETLVQTLERPYQDQPKVAHLAEPPRPDQRVLRTFCGT